jgi:hypothetical protein
MMAARDVLLGSVIFYQHARSAYFHLFSVERITSAGPIARLISEIPGVVPPCSESLISAGIEVYVLSSVSRDYIMKFNSTKNLMTIQWPPAFVEASRNTVAKQRADVSPIQPTRLQVGQHVNSSAPPLNLFIEESRASAPRSKTPRGQSLTAAQASVLSADYEAVLVTGNINVYMMLYYLGTSSGSIGAAEGIESLSSFWGLDRWTTQLQPVHLLWMVGSLASVDIRLIAVCGTHTRRIR